MKLREGTSSSVQNKVPKIQRANTLMLADVDSSFLYVTGKHLIHFLTFG